MKFSLVMVLCLCASALPQQRKRRAAVDSESLKKDFERFLEDTNQRTALNDVTDRCSSIRRRCVESGQLFKRNVVCASNMKRYMNSCHLQIRSCDLLEQSGDELQQKRCLWIEVPDDGDNGDDSSGRNSKETNSKSKDEDSDVTGSDSKIDGKSEGRSSSENTFTSNYEDFSLIFSSSDEEDALTPTDNDRDRDGQRGDYQQ
ncbi:uncharacterized protein [Apostichopus japonicus]|uniref:uncharacterized protein n=1 Tax=Stichopus japonicus TaxID=307972 RepID=UPI003AB313B6